MTDLSNQCCSNLSDWYAIYAWPAMKIPNGRHHITVFPQLKFNPLNNLREHKHLFVFLFWISTLIHFPPLNVVIALCTNCEFVSGELSTYCGDVFRWGWLWNILGRGIHYISSHTLLPSFVTRTFASPLSLQNSLICLITLMLIHHRDWKYVEHISS